MASARREQLVDTATRLFYREGFHATGIDRVLSEAGVAKMTLYNHFKSKDELIVAALEHRDARFRAWLKEQIEARAAAPEDRLLALFDVLEEWFAAPDFNGCMFINATAEYPALKDPIHAVAATHKRKLFAYLHGLALSAGLADPFGLAAELALLQEGAVVMAHTAGHRDAAGHARRAAAKLIPAARG